MSPARNIRLACLISLAPPALFAQGIGNVSVEAHPAAFVGRAPARLRFVARIELEGARTFNYQWVRSDGAKGPVQVVQVKNPRQRQLTVADSWQLGAPGQRMEV